MLILGLDTTSSYSGISLVKDDNILLDVILNEPSSENLIVKIESLLSLCNYKLNDLNAIAVIDGPGTFTGVRTGMAITKTISQIFNIPVIGINKIVAITYDDIHISDDILISPLLDIKRGDMYASLLAPHNQDPEYIIEPGIYNIADWLEAIKNSKTDKKIIFTGSGTKIHIQDIKNMWPDPIINLDMDRPYKVAKLGCKLLSQSKGQNFMEIKPFYLRDAICG